MRNCNWNGSSKRLQLKWTQCLRPEIDRRTEATARHWRLWFHIRSNPTFLPLSPQLSFPRTTQSHPCPGCAQKCHLRQYSVLRAPRESCWPSRGELGDHRQPCGSGVWRPFCIRITVYSHLPTFSPTELWTHTVRNREAWERNKALWWRATQAITICTCVNWGP